MCFSCCPLFNLKWTFPAYSGTPSLLSWFSGKEEPVDDGRNERKNESRQRVNLPKPVHVSRDTAHRDGGDDDDDDVHEHYTLMMMLMTIGLVARGCFSGSGSFPLPRVARSWRSLHPWLPQLLRFTVLLQRLQTVFFLLLRDTKWIRKQWHLF